MSSEPITVLGIDPGTASTGYGVIACGASRLDPVCGGVIETSSGQALERRLGAIFARVDELLEEHSPDAVAVEDIFFGRNVRTAFAVGQARGVVLGAAGLRDIPCFAYTPQAVKLSVCGSGAAAKQQVQRMVAMLLRLSQPPEPDHTADALAVAICHANRARHGSNALDRAAAVRAAAARVTPPGGDGAVPSIGLFAVNQHADGEAVRRIGTLAEQLGYDSLWVGEHVVVPDPHRPPSPMGPLDPILDPLVALAYLAAHTQRVRLATGIVILPQRNPVVLAKQLASLDVVSGGRLTFGMGVGYLEPEMTAIGVPMKGRGARAVEYLQAMRALWEQEQPSFEGEFVDFTGVNAHPRPLQRPLPVVMGGHSSAAHERAVRHANGWYGFMLDLEQTAEQVAGLRRGLDAAGREASEFEISVTPRGRLDAHKVAAYGRLGVNRLVLVPRGSAPAEVESFVSEHSPERIGGATPVAASGQGA